MQKRNFPAAEAQGLQAPPKPDTLGAASEELFEQSTPIPIVRPEHGNRRWFKSELCLRTTNIPRDVFFCDHANRGDEVFYLSNQARTTEEQNCSG